jgi:4-alpha-glucanotransferase
MKIRRSGILLHITSLPSSHGIGDLGSWAFKFADFLADAKQSFWQILPLNPTHPSYGDSPYSSISAFAGNMLVICPEDLVRKGFLTDAELRTSTDYPAGRVDYLTVRKRKEKLFRIAYERFRAEPEDHDFLSFCSKHSSWLDDFSLFTALKTKNKGKSWHLWPSNIRNRDKKTLQHARNQLHDDIQKEKFLQYIFHKQWSSLKKYCNNRGIQVIGDIPLYVSHDSADIWTNQEIFKLDENRRPSFVAGVPPDYFSKTGQLWGNPVYKWDVLKEHDFDWWVQRVRHNLSLYDLVRIDHFRGFVAYWEVPADEKTAENGTWVTACADDFFSSIFKKIPCLPVIAEDVGKITPDVKEILHRFEFPGTRPLLFAFGKNLSKHSCAPHNIRHNSVVYTGTHDCNTVRGWYRKEATSHDRKRLSHYLGKRVSVSNVHRELIRLAMMTVANTVIIPMQDILGLDENARMNTPGTRQGNWQWRLIADQLTPAVAGELSEITELYGRV